MTNSTSNDTVYSRYRKLVKHKGCSKKKKFKTVMTNQTLVSLPSTDQNAFTHILTRKIEEKIFKVQQRTLLQQFEKVNLAIYFTYKHHKHAESFCWVKK